MQTIVDAIRSLQVIYEHKIILPFRRAGQVGFESKRKHFRRFHLSFESLATEILCIALIPRLTYREFGALFKFDLTPRIGQQAALATHLNLRFQAFPFGSRPGAATRAIGTEGSKTT